MSAPMTRASLFEAIDLVDTAIVRERNLTGPDTAVAVPPKLLQEILAAARTHRDAMPRTKEVDVWHVEYGIAGILYVAVAADADIARSRALTFRQNGFTGIRVTGPHRREVSA